MLIKIAVLSPIKLLRWLGWLTFELLWIVACIGAFIYTIALRFNALIL